MNLKEAFQVVYQLSRAAPVVGDIGDKRDTALALIKKLVEEESAKKTAKPSNGDS